MAFKEHEVVVIRAYFLGHVAISMQNKNRAESNHSEWLESRVLWPQRLQRSCGPARSSDDRGFGHWGDKGTDGTTTNGEIRGRTELPPMKSVVYGNFS